MQVFRSITSVPEGLWDKAAGQRLGFDRRLLSLMESAGGQQPVYFLLEHAGGGVTIAAACEYLDRSGANPLSDLLFGRLDGRLPWIRSAAGRVLVIGSRFTHRSGIVTAAAPCEDACRNIEEFLAELATYTEHERMAAVFMDIPYDDDLIASVLRDLRCLEVRARPVARLPMGWPDWRDYVAAARTVSANAASTIRKEVNRARRDGITISEWNSSETPETELRALYDDHHRRLNGVPLRYQQGFFAMLKERLGDSAEVLVAQRGDTIVGSTFVLAGGGEAVLPLVGINHSADRGNFTYFNLVFYEPIRRAIARDWRLLTMGPGALGAKIRRGCIIETPTVFWRPAGRTARIFGAPVARAQRVAMKRKFLGEAESEPFSVPVAG